MNRPGRTWTGWLAALGMAAIAVAAQAAGLSFSPVRVTLQDPGQIQNLRVRNTADEPMVVQVAVKDLAIADDREHYADTDALVVTPPVFTLGPAEEQIVRLGLRNPAPVETERAFRVFFEQSPARPAASGEGEPVRVQVNLRVGIPVFVRPVRPLPRTIDWQMESLGDGAVRVSAVNRGNTHARISRLALLDERGAVLAEADGLIYLLPGSRRSWTLKLPAGAARPHRLRFEDQLGAAEAALPPA